MSRPIRLVIADDHAVMREGLAGLLDDEPDMQVVAQAGTGTEALQLVRQHRPDVALLDITMPGLTGLEVAHELMDTEDVKILILTMHEEEAFFFRALQEGAGGYILKGAQTEELLSAIRAVHAGGVYLPPALAGSLVVAFRKHEPLPPEEDPLTPRQREVLSLIARGLTNTEIAEELTLSVNTVKSHRLHIYQKLDLHDRSELIRYAIEQGLIQT